MDVKIVSFQPCLGKPKKKKKKKEKIVSLHVVVGDRISTHSSQPCSQSLLTPAQRFIYYYNYYT